MRTIWKYVVQLTLIVVMVYRTTGQNSSISNCRCCAIDECKTRLLPCSANTDCECLYMTATHTGLCADTSISCQSLIPCLTPNNTCIQPNTICVNNTRCRIPVCYPIELATIQRCPYITSGNSTNGINQTTRTTTIPTTTGPIVSNTTTRTTTIPTTTRPIVSNTTTRATTIPTTTRPIVSNTTTSRPTTSTIQRNTTATLTTPRVKTWTVAPNMLNTRCDFAVTLLTNDKVFVIGGSIIMYSYPNDCIGSGEIFDLSNNTWKTTNSLVTWRSQFTATTLSNGKVLIVGGKRCFYTGSALSVVEFYDPVTDSFSITDRLTYPRMSHTAIRLNNGKVLVFGGHTDGDSTIMNTCELFNPVTELWETTGSLNVGRYGSSVNILQNGTLLIIGGQTRSGCTATVELYDPATGNWTQASSLPEPRCAHSVVTLRDGNLLIIGGVNGYHSDSVLIYNVTNGISIATDRLFHSRRGATAFLLETGKVLVTGGDTVGTEIYDPVRGLWAFGPNSNIERRLATIVHLSGWRVLTLGGISGNNCYLTNVELFS